MLADVLVVVVAIGQVGFLTLFFFGKRTAAEATGGRGVRRVTVAVQGGYSPNVVRARKGVPPISVRLPRRRRPEGSPHLCAEQPETED